MPAAPRVRPAGPEDAPAIGRVHAASWKAAYAGILPRDSLAGLRPRALAQRWAPRLEGVWVAERAEGVEGFVLCGPTRDRDVRGFAGEIQMLYVHPDAWGQGIGAALLEAAAHTLHARGHRWLVIWVLAENTAAQAFYRRMGLRRDGRRRVDRGTRGHPWLLRYARPLGDATAAALGG